MCTSVTFVSLLLPHTHTHTHTYAHTRTYACTHTHTHILHTHTTHTRMRTHTDAVNFLGISVVGQTNEDGVGGIYVGSVMKG